MCTFDQNHISLVTGAATGIGLATAHALAEAGATVILSDRDTQRGQAAADELNQKGYKADFIACDVGVSEDIEKLHAAIEKKYGRLDSACNNAGIEGEQAPTGEATLENFDHVLNINLRGLFWCMHHQVNIMNKQGKGSIVNIASVAGIIGFAGLPAYCASKGGVVQLTKTTALEYAENNIRVNAICPGAVKTEMIDRITKEDPETEKQFAALQAMNRMGTSSEIADSVVWLCSDQSSFVTGQAIPVDGGFTTR